MNRDGRGASVGMLTSFVAPSLASFQETELSRNAT